MSHPTGNANVRAAAKGFVEANILAEFNTAIAAFPGTILNYLSGFGPLGEIGRRRFDPSLKPVTKTYPWKEIGRLVASRVGIQSLIKHETGTFCIDAVYKNMDCWVERGLQSARQHGVDAVYGYEDCALQTFVGAKACNMLCFYDLPIGYWRAARRLLQVEREKWPEWIPTLTGFRDSEEKLNRKDEEIKLADRIFVASRFTALTLQDFPSALPPIEVIPYGFPPVCMKRDYTGFSGNRPLKLLFVGGLSQRKGLANIIAAVDAIGPRVQLTIVGQKASNSCRALDAALNRYKWIPSLPNSEILQLMQQHDVLVFPSLFEGFGLVITEAMSQGTPVITTDRTAGPDLISQGENGWIVEAGSSEALIRCIEELLSQPKQVSAAGKAAMEAAKIRPWEVYGTELAKAVQKTIQIKS
jgi:glycosyltransferase involved in cell wall biosynthesis